jgi:hypothetical protein
VTKSERERRRRAKRKAQKKRRRENVIKDAEARLLGRARTIAFDIEIGGTKWPSYTDVP